MIDLSSLTKDERELYQRVAVTTTGCVSYLRPEHLTKFMTVDELWEWLRANIFTENP